MFDWQCQIVSRCGQHVVSTCKLPDYAGGVLNIICYCKNRPEGLLGHACSVFPVPTNVYLF